MTTGNERTLNMLNTARQMETKGHEFYEQAVAKSENELGRDIFRMLRQDEMVHLERINAIFEQLTAGRGWTGDWKALQPAHGNLGELFRAMAQKHGRGIRATTKDLDALDIGIDFEAKSIAFYEQHGAEATEALEQEFIECMIDEEKKHHRLLVDMKFYLQSPDSWFQEMQRGILDGV